MWYSSFLPFRTNDQLPLQLFLPPTFALSFCVISMSFYKEGFGTMLWAFPFTPASLPLGICCKRFPHMNKTHANPLLQHIHNHVRAVPKAQDLCCPTCRSSQKYLTPRREPLNAEQQNQHVWVQHHVLRRTSSLEGLPWDKPDCHRDDSITKYINHLTLLILLACLLHSYHRHLGT